MGPGVELTRFSGAYQAPEVEVILAPKLFNIIYDSGVYPDSWTVTTITGELVSPTEGLLNALMLLYADDLVLLAPDSRSLEAALPSAGPGG